MSFRKSILTMGGFLVVCPVCFAQTKAVRVCVRQVRGPETPPRPDYDARKLAEELSGRELPRGGAVEAVLISKGTRAEVNGHVKQQGCEYLVDVWRHGKLNAVDSQPPPADMPLGRTTLDLDTVDFELRDLGSNRVVARGLQRVPTVYHRGGRHYLFLPYPVLAKEISVKLGAPR